MFYDSTAFLKAVVTSLITFSTVHYILSKIIFKNDKQRHWNHVNLSTSLIHSIISTIMCFYCVYEDPKMCTTDMISTFTSRAYSFVSFEIGYFLFDSIDMLRKSRSKQTYEILLHHIIIILCFGISVYNGLYIGYSVFSLFLEVNSIFLHSRQLLLFSNISKQSIIYRVNSFLNISTFLIFRFLLVIYMSFWLYVNRFFIPLIFCCIGQTGLLTMTIININLFYRIIKKDFHFFF